MNVSFCPMCDTQYGVDETYCEHDGAPLVPRAHHDPLIGTVLDGRFEIRALLGAGGMGKVYEALQLSIQIPVAIKVLHPQISSDKTVAGRFLSEARSASKLESPHAVKIFDFGSTQGGTLFMVQELLHGQSLADVMEWRPRLSWRRTATIVAQACDALADAHDHKIVHRDLKPENIFLTQLDGAEFVKVLDFGIARVANMRATDPGIIVGSPLYMSPEQAQGKEIDGRSDIYTMGSVMYEMLAGQELYGADSALQAMMMHINNPPPELNPDVAKTVPERVRALMYRMLAKDPAHRPAACREVRDELMDCVAGATHTQLEAAPPPKPAPRKRPVEPPTTVLQPSSIAVRDRGGLWATIIASSGSEGVVQHPRASELASGQSITLIGAVPPLHGAVVTAVAVTPEKDAPAADCVRVRWMRVVAPTDRQLRAAVQELLGRSLPELQAPPQTGKQWLAFDLGNGTVRPVVKPNRAPGPERPQFVTRRRRHKSRKVLSVTAKKGDRGRGGHAS